MAPERPPEPTSGNFGLRPAESCPYCESKSIVKRGKRKKLHEEVQLYLCRYPACGRTFTATSVKGKHFPLQVIIEGLSYHNLGFTLEDTCKLLSQKFQLPAPVSTSALSSWVAEYAPLCRFDRLRPYALRYMETLLRERQNRENGKPKGFCSAVSTSALGREMVEVVTLAHRQLYRFRYHRAKTALMLQEFRNRQLQPLKDYLDGIASETPHQYFQEGERMSEIRSRFDKAEMVVKSKFNYANRLADFVLQGVRDNKARHEEIQRFMVANDSVTVASEVPVYIRRADVEHMENELEFKICDHPGADVADSVQASIHDLSQAAVKGKRAKVYSAQRTGNLGTGKPGADVAESIKAARSPETQDGSAATLGTIRVKGSSHPVPFPALLTGHIDLVQVRNGQIHLLDYKPQARRERPIEQLTWYALALSRLTGLRLFEFKCAWFDEKDYYEFYPLHVVKKIRAKRRRKVHYRSGLVVEVPKTNVLTVV